MNNKFVLVGNPNTGKTTLFNKLTKSHEKIANYSGVTTGVKSKNVTIQNKQFEIVDLPGLYSFDSSSEDEVVTKNYLDEHNSENIIFVCASNRIKKNLVLIDELKKYNDKIVVVINKIKEGLPQDVVSSLTKELGVPVVQTDVRKSVDEVIDVIANEATDFLNSNFKLDKLFSLIPTNPTTLKLIDKLLLHEVWGKLLFVAVFITIIIVAYGRVGGIITEFLEETLVKFGGLLSNKFFSWGFVPLADFWNKVIIGGVGSVLIYLPQLALMLTMLFLLEDMGYLPRVGNLFNYNLETIGMNGKSVFSLIMGVGCTTSAILTSRNVGSKSKRLSTVGFLPFVGCSAKIPVVLFLSGAIVSASGGLYAVASFSTVLIIGVVFLYFTKSEKEENYFITELPTLKKPSVLSAVREALRIVFDLVKKIFVTVLLSSAILWLLLNITPDFKFFSGEKSLIEYACEYIAILLKPIGLNKPAVVLALISGLIAKENILSTLGMFGGVAGFGACEIISFMIFVLSYSPCLPALKCAGCEFGKKYAGKWFLVQMGIAYLASFVFWTFSNIWIPLGFIMLIVFAFLMIITKKYFFTKKNQQKAIISA